MVNQIIEVAEAKVPRVAPLVLHLCGSRVSEYYEGVSAYYASACFNTVKTQGTYRHAVARVHQDGTWSFPEDCSQEAADAAKRMTLVEAMQHIVQLGPCALNPIMFCLPGMTTYRALFEALEIPMIGCGSSVMALSTNKAQSRAVVASAGVRVPDAELLRPGDRPKMSPPFVLKPCNEDNSMGVTLYKGESGEDLDAALQSAFSFDSEVLCERFVELGREIRCAVLEEDDGSLELLPCLEYFLTKDHPIRASNDKLVTDSRGVPTTVTTGNRKCPADIDPVLQEKLKQLCVRSHKALGCRDYSLYDVRVDPNGEPYFLEACLYCSFAPKSVIIAMAEANGRPQKEIFEMLVERTRNRKQRAAETGQLFGMKAA
jgi:D-alanine-D-alanine ligase